MGGFGSGRNEYARTPTVGECHTLDVTHLTDALDEFAAQNVAARGGEMFTRYRWCDEHGHGEEVASLGLYFERDGTPVFGGGAGDREDVEDALAGRPTHARLEATVTPPGGDPKDLEYRIRLEYTACNFGGVRPWFRCPGDGCGERVGKLYRPLRAEAFACRECYDLGYRSSRTSGNDLERAEQRYRKAFAKADAKDRRPHPNNAPYFPERPTGMHHDTFADLVDDVQAARREWQDAMDGRLEDLADRFDHPALEV